MNFEFHPGPLGLITGGNGSGKTTLLEALQSVRDLLVDRRSVFDCFPPGSRTRWDQRNEQTIQIEVARGDEIYAYELKILHAAKDRLVLATIASERLTLAGRTLFRFDGEEVHLYDNNGKEGAHFAFKGSRSFFAQLDDRPATRNAIWFRKFVERAWLGQLDPFAMSTVAASEDRLLDDNGENFASWYRNLAQESPGAMQDVLVDLKAVFPHLQYIKLVSYLASRALTLTFAATASDTPTTYDVSFDELSDGQRALIALYALFHAAPTDTLLFVDEPDNFVASREIQPLLSRALDLARARRIQLILVSHHPEVMNYIAPDGLWFMTRTSGGPVTIRRIEANLNSGQTADEAVREAME